MKTIAEGVLAWVRQALCFNLQLHITLKTWRPQMKTVPDTRAVKQWHFVPIYSYL